MAPPDPLDLLRGLPHCEKADALLHGLQERRPPLLLGPPQGLELPDGSAEREKALALEPSELPGTYELLQPEDRRPELDEVAAGAVFLVRPLRW